MCRDGTRRPVDDYRSCNWGSVPSRAIVTSSATNVDTRKLYQNFLIKASRELRNPNAGSNSSVTNDNRSGFRDGFDNRPAFDNRQGFDDRYDDRNNTSGYRNFNYNNRNGSDRSYDQQGNNGLYNWERPGSGSTDNPIPSDILPVDSFDLFESSPRYGSRHNLLFSVSLILRFDPCKICECNPSSRITPGTFHRWLKGIKTTRDTLGNHWTLFSQYDTALLTE